MPTSFTSDENSTRQVLKSSSTLQKSGEGSMEMGLTDVNLDNNCYHMATLRQIRKGVPVIGFIAHFDTILTSGER